MKVVTASEMQLIDKKAIEEYGIPSLTLMENAGKSVAETIIVRFPNKKRIAVFAGKGNNGGDGLVTARYLVEKGHYVQVFLAGKKTEVSPDAKVNLDRYLKLENVPKIIEVTDSNQIKNICASLIEFDLIVDALLGTGSKGVVKGLLADLINLMNESKKPIVSIDLPSGINADTGEILGTAVKAEITVTLGLPKVGLVIYPGAEYVGDLVIADIGLPKEIIISENIKLNWITKSDVYNLLPKRKPNSHKGDYGHVFVLAGSVGFTGAASLVCEGALRIGAGLVTLGIPKSLNPIMEVKLTEVMTYPLEETANQSLALAAEPKILEFIKNRKCNSVAVGPGLSLHPETVHLLYRLIPQMTIPMVIDADALTAIAQKIDILSQVKVPVILTPHPGEMARLIGSDVSFIQSRRIETAREFAQTYKLILVLKGARTVVADPLGEVFINSTGNPGMASGGVGDVLTGFIAGLLAQKLNPLESAILGVYLHGLAGDIASHNLTYYCTTATDILFYLPQAIKQIEN